ncbi:MAG: calcium-binding protein, partial [Rhodobacteraceae bacterium]|nr:calcium-binding protein [Paracoccaceae bacterium]
MTIISYLNQQIAQATAFDVGITSGDTLIVSSNSTLIATVGNAFGPFVDNVDYFIYGEVFGGWDSYADKVRITIGETGSFTETNGFMQMNHGYIVNHGTLTSNSNLVISKYDDPFNDPLWTNDLTIFNTGNIIGNSNDIYADRGTIESSGERTEIINHGLISGFEKAIRVTENNASDGEAHIENYGVIHGDIDIQTSTADKVINGGSIYGNVELGDGDDTYDGRGGSLNGTVNGGAGDDTYIIDDATIALSEDAAEGNDTVHSTVGWTLGDNFENLTLIGSGDVDGYGNGESNTITGNQGDNVLNGLGSADTLYGGAGDDKVNGGNGIDNLFGGVGDDRLRGQKGFDVLKAEEGNDALYGGSGDDNLFGGDDKDILKGGMGRDKLYGGDDADVFLFTKAAQSKNDSTADKIQDFELGLDT